MLPPKRFGDLYAGSFLDARASACHVVDQRAGGARHGQGVRRRDGTPPRRVFLRPRGLLRRRAARIRDLPSASGRLREPKLRMVQRKVSGIHLRRQGGRRHRIKEPGRWFCVVSRGRVVLDRTPRSNRRRSELGPSKPRFDALP